MYTAYGLLTPGTDFSMAAARERLQEKFPAASVTLDNNRILLAGSDWEFQLQENASPELVEEHANLAIKLGSIEDNPEVAASTRRVEVWSDTNDPFLEHFNDFHQVIEVLQSFQGVIAIDPKEPAFM